MVAPLQIRLQRRSGKKQMRAETIRTALDINSLRGRGGGIRTPDPLLPKQMRYQTALRPDRCSDCIAKRFPTGPEGLSASVRSRHERNRPDGTIERIDGGYSSAAERLTVAQDVVGSIPTSRPTPESNPCRRISRRAERAEHLWDGPSITYRADPVE